MALQISPQAVEIPSFRTPQPGSSKVYDIICVGFGTAALAIAVALQDNDNREAKVLFLEREDRFEQTANGTKKYMSTCFAEDLATLRDPTSKFTFLNYLHSQGKLDAFLALFSESPYPMRKHFNVYLAWCASQFVDRVFYDQEVVSVKALDNEALVLWTVSSMDVVTGKTTMFAARNVVVATGGEARIVKGYVEKALNFGRKDAKNLISAEDESKLKEILRVTNGLQDVSYFITTLYSSYKTNYISRRMTKFSPTW